MRTKLTNNRGKSGSAESIRIHLAPVGVQRIGDHDEIRRAVRSSQWHHVEGPQITWHHKRIIRSRAPFYRAITGDHCDADAVIFIDQFSCAWQAGGGVDLVAGGSVVETVHGAGEASIVHQTADRSLGKKQRLLQGAVIFTGNNVLPRVGQSHAICVIRKFQFLPMLSVLDVITFIWMVEFPLKSTYTCCPVFSPQITGTGPAPPVIVRASVSQTPCGLGWAKFKLRKSIRTWKQFTDAKVRARF